MTGAGEALQPLVQPVETVEVPHELQPVETELQPLVQVLHGAGAEQEGHGAAAGAGAR